MKTVFIFFVILIFACIASPAQKLLTADSAAAIALKNNFDIRIARTTADISKRNNTAGNAGMLPEAGITATDAYSLGHVNQHYSDGTSATKANANSNSLWAGIALNWTLFDGGKMFVTKKKLNEIEALGEIQFRNQVMQTLYDVYAGYFNVVKQKEQLQAIREVIRFNQERVDLLQASFNAGLAPKTDLLQAKIDLNVYQENAISQLAVILAARRQLNQLLSRDPEEPFEVIDTIILDYHPDKKELAQKLFTTNPSVLSSQKQVEVARLGVNEFKALQLPSVNFSAGYDFLHSDNATGTVRMNDSYGPQVGATLSIPLYQAGNIRRQIAIAQLQLESARVTFESAKLQVNTQLQLALTEFDNQLQLLQIEKNNFALAKENLTISIQRLRLGQTTALEVRQAQESYQESLTRLTNFGYAAKVAEIRLKQLMGAL
ncbi:MAG: TolC family protein [Porphyromonadaceae bacterium]|nr:MAG: TolC family protein [Porphyromonadaceae bacterium]